MPPRWLPGAGGKCLHTVILDPVDPKRIFVNISADGEVRTDDGGQTWRTVNHGLNSPYELPDPSAEVGHCVHNTAMIRVVLPYHLKTLAQVSKEVYLQVKGPPTVDSLLDALETTYPMLSGAIRDHISHQRRPFLRFFACG